MNTSTRIVLFTSIKVICLSLSVFAGVLFAIFSVLGAISIKSSELLSDTADTASLLIENDSVPYTVLDPEIDAEIEVLLNEVIPTDEAAPVEVDSTEESDVSEVPAELLAEILGEHGISPLDKRGRQVNRKALESRIHKLQGTLHPLAV